MLMKFFYVFNIGLFFCGFIDIAEIADEGCIVDEQLFQLVDSLLQLLGVHRLQRLYYCLDFYFLCLVSKHIRYILRYSSNGYIYNLSRVLWSESVKLWILVFVSILCIFFYIYMVYIKMAYHSMLFPSGSV